MFKFRETFVRKSKVSSSRGFSSPAKPAKPTTPAKPAKPTKPTPINTAAVNNTKSPPVKQEKKPTPEVDKKDDESVFELGDEHFGAFGDMQTDSEFEEISIDSIFNDDDASGSSEFSERTVDEEEYELYMNTINMHGIQDFEEWRNSEHFPQHLFDSDDDEYDEITVDSNEFQQSLRGGGLVIDWTGTRITLDTFNDQHKKEKKKHKKKKKTTKIKVKKSKKSSKSSSSDKKKKRKSGKKDNLMKTNTSSGSSEDNGKSTSKPKLAKETPNDEEDASKGSSPKEGTKPKLSKERSKRRSSMASSLNGSSDSLTLMDLSGPGTPISTARKRQSSKKSSKAGRQSSFSGSKGQISGALSIDSGCSLNSSFDIPESMRNPRSNKNNEQTSKENADGGKSGVSKSKSSGSSEFTSTPRQPKRASITGSTDSPKSPKSPKSPHARASSAGRRAGRKSSSKQNLWADSMAALNKPEFGGRSTSTPSDSGEKISRKSNSRRSSSAHNSPKKRPSSTDSSGALNISRRSKRNSNTTEGNINAAIPRHSVGGSASPVSRRSSHRRRISGNNNNNPSKPLELDINSEHVGNTRRRSGGNRRTLEQKKRANSLGEMEQSGRLAAARDRLNNMTLEDSDRSPTNRIKNRRPEKRKSDRLLDIERTAREEQEEEKRSTSVSALEKRKGSHAALREKLAKAGTSQSTRALKQKYAEGADGTKEEPRRSSSLDAAQTLRRGKTEDSNTGSGHDRVATTKRSSSLGATGESRRVRSGKKRDSTLASGSDSISSLGSSKGAFDSFGVAVEMQNGNNDAAFADTSDRVLETSARSSGSLVRKPSDRVLETSTRSSRSPARKTSERNLDTSTRSGRSLARKPRKQDDMRLSNDGNKGPVSLSTPRKSPSGRKNKVSPRRSSLLGNNGPPMKRKSLQGVDTGISSREVTW